MPVKTGFENDKWCVKWYIRPYAHIASTHICSHMTRHLLWYVISEERLLTFIEHVLANPRMRDVQLPTGYSAMSEEVSGLVASFLRLVSYNQAVFGSYYSDIVASTLATPSTTRS